MDKNHGITYCYDANHVWYGHDPWPYPPHYFDTERNGRELLWGMLNTVGVPPDATKSWVSIDPIARAPLDLTFPA
jgi:hypothetical protein